MTFTELWKYSLAEDGWTMSHNAIRLDMADTQEILERIKAAPSVDEWEWTELLQWWDRVRENIQQHHDHEERIFFPMIRSRVELPPKLSSDHATLIERMTALSATVASMCGAKEFDATCLDQLKALAETMLPHLLEEEADTLPLMREHFKPGEVTKRAINPMIKEFAWLELPHFYRQHHGDLAKSKTHCVNVLGMPGPVWDYIENLPAKMRKYDALYGAAVVALKEPSRKADLDAKREAMKKSKACSIS